MFRKVTWYLKGRSTFTKSGFEHNSRSFTEDIAAINLEGRHFLVTGANSGIGRQCAHYFAKGGGTVHMVCRSKERGEEAKADVITQSGNQSVHLHILDMAESQSVARFAQEFIADGHPLDVLVNNAGCMLHTRTETATGMETNFAVNSFGPYLLTSLLLPVLQKSKDARVVFVSSGGMMLEKLNVQDPQLTQLRNFDGIKAYSQQKRQQVVMCRYFAEQFGQRREGERSETEPVSFYSMHPGWADTPAVRDALPQFYERMKDDLRTDVEGADTVMWLSASKEIPAGDNGKFFFDRAVAAEHLFLGFTQNSKAAAKEFIDYLEAEKTKVLEAL